MKYLCFKISILLHFLKFAHQYLMVSGKVSGID